MPNERLPAEKDLPHGYRDPRGRGPAARAHGDEASERQKGVCGEASADVAEDGEDARREHDRGEGVVEAVHGQSARLGAARRRDGLQVRHSAKDGPAVIFNPRAKMEPPSLGCRTHLGGGFSRLVRVRLKDFVLAWRILAQDSEVAARAHPFLSVGIMDKASRAVTSIRQGFALERLTQHKIRALMCLHLPRPLTLSERRL